MARDNRSTRRGEKHRSVVIPLVHWFRFAHEPLDEPGHELSDDERLFVGRLDDVEEFAHRLMRSHGGAFLITGYRGVGKTSFVNRVLRRLAETGKERRKLDIAPPGLSPSSGALFETHSPDREGVREHVELIDLRFNMARPLDLMHVLHHIIRGIHRRLIEKGLWRRLDPELRRDLKLAVERTSMSITLKTAQGIEVGPSWSKVSNLGLKLTGSREKEVEYAAYDEFAAEHDLISIARRLTRARLDLTPSPLGRLWNRARRKPPATRLHVVFVFDELDKIQTEDGEESPVTKIIASLKNLLTTSGIAFIFIAGRELEDVWHKDVVRGDGIYESVFSYNRYVPLLWNRVDELCDRMVRAADEAADSAAAAATLDPITMHDAPPQRKAPDGWIGEGGFDPVQVYADFKRYIAFHGRGIPRRALRTFHGQVVPHGNGAQLAFRRDDYRRIRFYADLELILNRVVEEIVDARDRMAPDVQRDQVRLALYYLVDWMIRRGPRPFTLGDARAGCHQLSERVRIEDEVAIPAIESLVKHLVDHRILEKLAIDNVTLLGAPREIDEPRYRLRDERLSQLGRCDVPVEQEASFFDRLESEPGDRFGRYEIRGFLGMGGMGIVYRAWDTEHQRDVALKVVRGAGIGDQIIHERFRREVDVLRQLQSPGHPSIVTCLDASGEPPRPFIAMELIEGRSLAALSGSSGLPVEIVLLIAKKAASAYRYIHEHGILRLDIKPSNILVERSGRVVITDFGIVRRSDDRDLTLHHIIGTPMFMAPEQFQGHRGDERSDVFSFGVTLYLLLTARMPFPFQGRATIEAWKHAHAEPAPPIRAKSAVGRELETIVLACLARNPDERCPSMAAIESAIPASDVDLDRFARWFDRALVGGESEDHGDTQSHIGRNATIGRDEPKTIFAPTPAIRSSRRPAVGVPEAPSNAERRAPTDDADAGISTPIAVGKPRPIDAESVDGGAHRLERLAPSPLVGVAEMIDIDANLAMPSSEPRISATYELRAEEGPARPMVWNLSGECVIGRDAGCDIVLRDPTVSKRHGLIREVVDGGVRRFLFQELGGKNGSFVNDHMVRQPVWLTDGARIRVGGSVVAFRMLESERSE